MHTIPMTLQQYINESEVTDTLCDLLTENILLKSQAKGDGENLLALLEELAEQAAQLKLQEQLIVNYYVENTKLKQNLLDVTSVASAMNYVNKHEYSYSL